MQNSAKWAIRIIAAILVLSLIAGFAVMAFAEEEGTLQEALDSGASSYQLTEDVDGITINKDFLLDLNGHAATNMTVAEGVTLQLVDSANDEYDASRCGSFSGTINGTVQQMVKHDTKNYLVVENGGVYSAHRFYAGITKISLAPAQVALGYKAEYYADEVINAMVIGYGYELWVNELNPVRRMKEGKIADNELTLRLKNILVEGNTALSDLGAAAQINGRAFIQFDLGVTGSGADHSTTLQAAVEAVNASLGQDRSAYSKTQIQAVRDLIEKFDSYMNTWEQEYIFTEDKFAAVENVSVTYGENLTLGQVFTAVEGMTIGENVTVTVNGEAISVDANWADTALNLNAGEVEITITDNDRCWTAANTVAVAKANPSYEIPTGLTATEGDALSSIELTAGFEWKNADEKVSLDKSEYDATFTPEDTDNYNIVDVKIPVAVSEKVKEYVDKFAVALYEGEPAFLYRVGNANTVKLGSLFKALDNADVGTVSVEIETLDGNVTGVYTANATWTDATIKFTNTGVVKVTISDEADNTIGNPVTITLEVIDATNVTAYSELKNRNSVLLNDITMSSGGAYYLSGATLYGNGFTFDMTDGNSSAPGYLSESYVFGMANANLDNAKVVGAVYTSYGATVKEAYNRPAIMTTGNCTITNSYVSNCAAPIRIKDGNLEIINTTLKGGNFANLDIRGGNVVLDNVTTINQVNGNDTAADGTVVVGFGVVVYYENVLESTTITVKNGITQYNEMSKAEAEKYITDSTAKILVQKIYASENSAVQYTDSNGVIWVNAGILSMEAAVGDANITDVNGYVDASPTMSNITGYLHTKVPTATSITAPVPEYVSAGQGSIAPSCSFDYETKNNVAKTDGSNDFCYYDNGTVMISMDDGDTFNWDTSILTATKLGTTLNYTVSMNGTDYTGKSIAFNQTGKYEVVYTYTDGNNYKLNASGEITTYEKTYTKTVHINVAVVMPDAKHAVFTFGSGNTASKQVTVGTNTYVMPNVSATSSTIGSTTVNGTTVYYPIVEIIMSDGKTSHSSAWYAYFPVFSGAVTITDYADAGTGSAVTYGSSTTTMPSGLSLVGDASTIFKYQSSSAAGTSPVVKSNILVYSSPSISAKRNEYNTVVQYKYQDNAGLTYYYYIGYHAPAQSYSSICVAPETLVTMADGTQKQIQYVSVGEEVVAWNFYTGKYDVVPVSLLQTHGTDVMDVLYLNFEDGTQLKVLGEHGIYDADLNTFIFIDKDDVKDYVGHSFVQKNGDSYDTVKLVGYEIVQEYTTAYTILSTGHYNVMLENMFTVTPAHVGGNFFNPFEVGEGMKYDEAKVQADIEKYGLYAYEDFDHVLTYEQFVALNLGHFKVSAGKGLVTYEGLIYLIQNFVNNEDYNQ